MAAIALAVAANSPARASVELEVVLDISFSDGCPTTEGYYSTWPASTYPDLETFFEEIPPVPVTWSPESPIRQSVFGPTSTDVELIFILIAADAETVLFERAFDVGRSPQSPTPRFAVHTTLACDTIPYKEIQTPDDEGPAPPWPWVAGGLAVLVVGSFALFRLWRA